MHIKLATPKEKERQCTSDIDRKFLICKIETNNNEMSNNISSLL